MQGGFRADCREQAGKAIRVLTDWMGRYAPKSTGRIAVRGGCLLLFPMVTLFVWFLQAIVWLIVALPILAYALVMAVIGGGFHRGVVAQAAPVQWPDPPPAPTPGPSHTPGEARSNRWIGEDGGM